MSTLGIDFGLAKVGIAVAEANLAEPLMVLRYKGETELLVKLKKIVEEISAEKVVVGFSEGKSGSEAKIFTNTLREYLNIPVEIYDETLTTIEAQRLAQEAGIKRKKRKALEDAYAATLILQNYLDANE
jgi:putative Holliday junction resolvase